MLALRDNAMLYKDTTQWLRNRSFELSFFGLLVIAEFVCLLVISFADEEANAGKIGFSTLFGILVLYALVVAVVGHNLTSREFFSKTFELYELAGMSLEKMVAGKLLSMMSQFLFGYFCIVPFLFFFYLLGGLDFSVVITSSFMIVLMVVPFYLVSLLIAFSFKTRGIKVVLIVLLILVVPRVFSGLIYMTVWSPRGAMFPFSGALRSVTSINTRSLTALAVYLIFYIQMCLFLFYLCCHSISGPNDSRELQIKAISFLLILSSLVLSLTLILSSVSLSGIISYSLFLPIFFLMLLVGFITYYNRAGEPRVVRNQYKDSTGLRRITYRLFRPGPRYLGRYYLLIMGMVLLYGALSYYVFRPSVSLPRGSDFLDALSLPLQVPFFIALPGGFILMLRSKKRDAYKNIRKLVLIWWLLAPLAFFVLSSAMEVFSMYSRRYDSPVMPFLTIFLAPTTTLFATLRGGRYMVEMIPEMRILMGILGLYLIYRFSRSRGKNAKGKDFISEPAKDGGVRGKVPPVSTGSAKGNPGG